MVTLVNTSGGNLHVDSLGLQLVPGARFAFECTVDELLVKAPEIVLFMQRGRAALDDGLELDALDGLPNFENPDELKGS